MRRHASARAASAGITSADTGGEPTPGVVGACARTELPDSRDAGVVPDGPGGGADAPGSSDVLPTPARRRTQTSMPMAASRLRRRGDRVRIDIGAFYAPAAGGAESPSSPVDLLNRSTASGIVLRSLRRNTDMKYHTDDTRITGMEEVQAPEALIAELPVSDEASRRVFTSRREISDIIHGRDDRLMVVIGPCSIHDPAAALDYADKLAVEAERFKDTLKIVMRVYFEKPRTTVGWKGLINDPDLNDSFDINRGLHIARRLLRDLIDRGLSTGTEYLDPISPQYFGDLVCWGAIGARTTESQIHRQLASGLSCPIGFKNSTDGSVQVAVDAVKSAQHPHIFLSVTKQGHSAIFSTSGNEDCHIILRGGAGRSNFDNPSVHYASRVLERAGLVPKLMIDMSHANSNKQHRQQIAVCSDICKQLHEGEPRIMGVMIESNLIEGRQDIVPGRALTYGQSITDACIGWDDSVRCLESLSEGVSARGVTRVVTDSDAGDPASGD